MLNIVILLSIALAMDAFAVAITLGMSDLAKHRYNRLKIALAFGLFQGGLFLLGYYAIFLIGKNITSYNSLIAGLLLAFLGIKMLLEAFDTKEKHCEHDTCFNCKKNRCLRTGEFRYLSFKLLISYATATSIDAFASGVSYSFKYDNGLYATIFISIITFSFSYFGVCCGKYLKKYIGKKAEIIGGLILLFLAIKTII